MRDERVLILRSKSWRVWLACAMGHTWRGTTSFTSYLRQTDTHEKDVSRTLPTIDGLYNRNKIPISFLFPNIIHKVGFEGVTARSFEGDAVIDESSGIPFPTDSIPSNLKIDFLHGKLIQVHLHATYSSRVQCSTQQKHRKYDVLFWFILHQRI